MATQACAISAGIGLTPSAVRQTVTIRRALLRWFHLHARPLPWRGSRDPYAVWVSEIMLQQTQVATVIPYYQRFLHTYPTVAKLAKAPLERVLELWSGLGYYRRARQLHRAARLLARKAGGRLPSDYQQVRSLPGIGDYTARAVLSIAFNQPYAVLDGNIARVVARLLALEGRAHQPIFRRAAIAALEHLISRRHPGDFNQSLMELGQTVCLPRVPRCSVCPLRRWCRGYRLGMPESFPAPRPRRATEFRCLAAAVVRRDSRVAMVRGLDEGLLGDLWNFPASLGKSRAQALRRLREKLRRLLPGSAVSAKPFVELHHGITFRSIRVQVYAAQVPENPSLNSLRWFPLSTLHKAAISQLARKIAKEIL